MRANGAAESVGHSGDREPGGLPTAPICRTRPRSKVRPRRLPVCAAIITHLPEEFEATGAGLSVGRGPEAILGKSGELAG